MMAASGHGMQRDASATVLIEGRDAPAERPLKAFLSASVTLTLGILGSSVLPVPFAFSRTGVLLGLLLSLLVAVANALTGTLILRTAGLLGEGTFEGLAHAASGGAWKLVTQVSMVLLLFGTLCGDYALLADCGRRALEGLFAGAAPAWAVAGDGRVPMVALGLLIVFPLSCMRRIRSLEYAAMAGVGLVFVLAGVIIYSAASAGFPAVRSGELPLTRLELTADLPEAVAVLGFAFYVQPMLLPLLKEMPAGQLGVDLTCRATQLVTMVVASLVYAVVGVFAAARYGLSTQGDVLVNQWLPGRWDGALDGLVAIYLSLSMVPMVMTMRFQLDSLITGDYAPYLLRRELALTIFSLVTSLLVALRWPTAAEKMFAVTGATAVCLVCYVIPVAIHLSIYFKGPRPRRRGSFSFQTGSSSCCPQLPLAAEAGADRPVAATAAAWPPPHAGAPGGGPPHVAVRQPDSFPAGPEGGQEEQQVPPPSGSGSGGGGSPAAPAPAQPLPVNAPRGSRGMPPHNISLDDWLPASHRSKDASSPESLGYESLGFAPPSPSARRGRRSSTESVGRPALPVQEAGHPGQEGMWPGGGQQFQQQQLQQQRGGSAGLPPRPAPPPAGGRGSWASLEEPLLPTSRHQLRFSFGSAGQLAKLESLGPAGPAPGAGPQPREAPRYPSVRDLAGRPPLQQAALLARHVGLPVFVMLVGTGCSVAALWLSVAALLQ